MSSSVEVISTVGVAKDDISYGSFRKWLTPIRVCAIVHEDLSRVPQEVGEALGFVIRRQPICHSFHKSMEPPSAETMKLALELFDRYGSLKQEIIVHPIRKGSGVWNNELDEGNFVIIEVVKVKEIWRKKGVGKRLVLKLLEEAMALRRNVKFTYVWPTVLNDEINDHGKQKLTREQKRKNQRKQEAVAISFFRTLNFRRVGLTEWFALARDEEHPSRGLQAHEDRDLIEEDMSDSESEEEDDKTVHHMSMNLIHLGMQNLPIISRKGDNALTPTRNNAAQHEDLCTAAKLSAYRGTLHYAIKNWTDSAGLKLLQMHAAQASSKQFDIEAVNNHGDTILHVAACMSKVASLNWITDLPIGTRLAGTRNHAGYTPLEALQAKLERERVGTAYGMRRMILNSDKFEGFNNDSVTCLLKLSGVEIMTAEQRARAKFGCSCGKCIAGYLSPRMTKKLLDEVQTIGDYLRHLCSLNDGKIWYLEFEKYLRYMPGKLRPNFESNIVLRKVFATLVDTIAECLADGIVPTKVNAMIVIKKTSTWSQIDHHYFQRGGTLAAITNVIIDEAKEHDLKAGELLYELEHNKALKASPECRNDYEFEFVRLCCVDDAAVKPQDGTEFPVEMPWLPELMRRMLEGKSLFT